MTRILVVDDSPTIRRVVTNILEVSGFDTVEATDGQDALDVLQSGDAKVDLVLLDFVMPRMNGFQFARALKKDTTFGGLPIILMSAKSDRIRAQFVEQTGSLDAIGKPFDAEALLTVVENALRRKNERPTTPKLVDPADVEDAVSEPEIVGGDAADDAEEVVLEELIVLDSIPPDEAVGSGDPTVLRPVSPSLSLASTLRETLAPVVKELSDPESALRISTVLTKDAALAIIRGATPIVNADPVLLSGDLSVLSASAILQLLQSESQTGRLLATRGRSEITVTFRGGKVDLVQSREAGDEFRLGRYFVSAGLVKPEEVDAVARGVALPKRGLAEDQKKPFDGETTAPGPSATPPEEATTAPGEKSVKDVVTLESEKAVKPGPADAKSAAEDEDDEQPIASQDLVLDDDGQDHDNETRIVASAFKREVEMPKEGSSGVLGGDDVADAPDSSPDTQAEESPDSRPPPTVVANSAPPPQGPRPLLGDALVSAGIITEEQLRDALIRQSSELIYELLRWQKGRFELVSAPPPPLAERTKLGLPVAQLVMEGFRRVNEWQALEASVGDFESVLYRDDVVMKTMKDDTLTRAERRVLDAVDSERTVREVIAATHLGSFDACRILAQFLEARIVRRRTEESDD
jgi:CheY-like chemotaxis protein